MNTLDTIYSLIRVRFTKGGHKTNRYHAIRQSFICQCHGRGSQARLAVYRKRQHFFEQSACRARISIRQVTEDDDVSIGKDFSSDDCWILDKVDLQHNH